MKPVSLILFVLLVGASLAGCGQKGGLYLPAHHAAPSASPGQPQDDNVQQSGQAGESGQSAGEFDKARDSHATGHSDSD